MFRYIGDRSPPKMSERIEIIRKSAYHNVGSRSQSLPAIGNMTLIPGTKLVLYQISTALGAGGIDEVYRARNSRLEGM